MNFRVADHEHEGQLRELLRNTPMPGRIRLAFGREPDYFLGAGVQGPFNQTIVALQDGRVIGTGARAIRPAWINGQRAEIGYLSGLRIEPAYRGGSLLARGYTFLKQLHDARPAPAYLTTIVEENRPALQVLTSGRGGLPHYHDFGRYYTYAVYLKRRRHGIVSRRFSVQNGAVLGTQGICDFLAESGAERQFFPSVTADHFGSEWLRNLQPEHFRVALDERGGIAGVAAAWNQMPYKQYTVAGYDHFTGITRAVINCGLRLRGYSGMPPSGNILKIATLAFPCVRGNRPDAFDALFQWIFVEQAEAGYQFMMAGFHERDPLRHAIERFFHYKYVSRVYLVYWDKSESFRSELEEHRVPYLELGML